LDVADHNRRVLAIGTGMVLDAGCCSRSRWRSLSRAAAVTEERLLSGKLRTCCYFNDSRITGTSSNFIQKEFQKWEPHFEHNETIQ
jgi:hypothetical protein